MQWNYKPERKHFPGWNQNYVTILGRGAERTKFKNKPTASDKMLDIYRKKQRKRGR